MSSAATMNGRPRKKLVRSLLFAYAALALFTSCSTTPSSDPPSPVDGGLMRDPVLGVADSGVRCTIPAMLDPWHRRANTPLEDFPMGPGDEVTVSVPEIEELQDQHARISQDGTVSLPLIGTVKVGGMDEDRARVAISQRLARYMKVPRLEMYVERYRSRGVAV